MGRAGPGVFDSDQACDAASDLSVIIGIDLSSAGYPHDDMDEDWPPILSVEESAAHLNDGNFARTFDILRTTKQYFSLVLFVLLSMRVGAKIDDKYLRYCKSAYKKADAWEFLPESREQIKTALKEYKSGLPYELKEFDFGDDWAGMSDPEEMEKAMRVG